MPGANAANTAEPRSAAQDFVLQQQALLAVLVLDQLRGALAILRVHVVIPERERFKDVSIGVDYVVMAAHDSLHRRSLLSVYTTVPGEYYVRQYSW